MKKKDLVRESKFELMRIVAMLFIITGHIIYHGHMIQNTDRDSLKIILQIISYVVVVHVSLFVLLTGYFQSKSKFKLNKFLKLIIITIFYSITLYIISIKIGWITEYDKISIFNNMNLSAIGGYWFITSYLILYALSDFINIFINTIDKKQYHKILVILFLILSIVPFLTGSRILANTGFNFYSFVFLYLIGAYLRIYPLKKSYLFKKTSRTKYIIIMSFVFFLMVYMNFSTQILINNFKDFGNVFNEIYNRLVYTNKVYSSPFCIIQAISLFEIFNNINIKSKGINYISKYVIGVYLIHDNANIRHNIYKIIGIDAPFSSYYAIIKVFLFTIAIFVVCLIIDIIRDKLFALITYLYQKIKRKKITT